MKILIDIAGLSGFGLAMAGLYLDYGLATALQIGGVTLVIYALVAARRRKCAV
ncbi:hypothetical protein PSI22_18985 [Xenorhabdus sp. XENO-7]|uniref:MFS transporter n=1 Tax=Xenorhabdus aichiensis TaxID=3025874 RepID=A0ABT5M7I8_9GAMM|nr:hypothetical protein [Xenorhabdus aichiensis]MDC9623663.1 hypothetical protein [Xenorhabdus aichiensis]